MWNTLRTNLISTQTRKISTLLYSSIIKHVRNIHLLPGRGTQEFTYNFKILLDMLQKDRLNSFMMTEDITSAEILCILQLQGKLSSLCLSAIDFSDLPLGITVKA